MKIYTKTGDKGTTSLASGERVSKTDARLDAYGTSDELNSFVGFLRAAISDPEIDAQLYSVQNRLFDIGATLAGAPTPIPDDCIQTLEHWIDAMQAELPPLRAFILPAGSEVISRCHLCRTVCRRLERACLRIEGINESANSELIYINRLSDYFFVLARRIGQIEGIEPVKWQK